MSFPPNPRARVAGAQRVAAAAALTLFSSLALAQGLPGRTSAGAPWGWSARSSLPVVKAAGAAVRLGDEILLLGGADNYTGNGVSNVAQAYRPASRTWRPLASIPDFSTFGSLGTVVGGKVYLIGGWSAGTYFCREYDPALDLWQYRAPSPQPVKWGHTGAALGGRIYVLWYFLNCYEPASDQWTTGYATPLNFGYGMSAEAIDGKLYVVGTGDELQIYDPDTNTWAYGPDLPVETYAAATAVVNGKLYVAGGGTDYAYGAGLDALQVYDPATGTWTLSSPLPALRCWAPAVGFGDELHVLGGFDAANLAMPEVWTLHLWNE